MSEPWKLDDCQQLLEAELAEALERNPNLGDDSKELIDGLINHIMPKLSDTLYADFAKRSKSMLQEHRRLRQGFVKRNKRRWQKGFDLLERLIVISEEAGSAINDVLRPTASVNNDAVFEAVISNHARAVQVSREILSLMIAGFPDGALARWRTLHEIAVISFFIADSGPEIAERYILHDHITAYKRAKNYVEHHERANLEPIEPAVMSDLKIAYDEIVGRYGDGIKLDYGWAIPALGRTNPTFAALEIATKLDHWRPRYKWAAINTHGSYRGLNSTLSTCESREPVLLVGESNSGMTDPGHMTAISLNIATMPVITLEPNIDRLAIAAVMDRLSDEIGETFWRVDQESYENAQKDSSI